MDAWISTVAAVSVVSITGFAAYLALALRLARVHRLPDPEDMDVRVEPLGRTGHHIALARVRADAPRYAEPVILCHGLGANRFNLDIRDDGHGQDRLSLALFLARAGFDVWVLETRGHGRATVTPGEQWTAEDELAEDVPVALQTVLDATGAQEVFWVGHSWGGVLQYLFQARGHPLADRVKGLVAVGSPGTLDVQPELPWLRPLGAFLVKGLRIGLPIRFLARWSLPLVHGLALLPRLLLPRQAVMEGRFLMRLFANLPEDVPRGWLEHALGYARRGGFTTPEGDRVDLSRLRLPLLLLSGTMDRIAPPEALAYVADQAQSDDVTLRVMGRAHGCRVDYGHGGLLVAREAPDEVHPVIREWLTERASR